MVKNPVTVTPDVTVAELLDLIETHHFSGLPVVEGKKLVGIVTVVIFALKPIIPCSICSDDG